jgi:hypothetical protein
MWKNAGAACETFPVPQETQDSSVSADVATLLQLSKWLN